MVGAFSSGRTSTQDRRVAPSTATWIFSQPARGEEPGAIAGELVADPHKAG